MEYRLYRRESSDPKIDAQRNLAGRTHYVDDDTLRFHKARILSANVVDGGLLYAIIESVSLDWNHTSRGFRYAIFDLFGNVVDRPDLEHAWKSSDAARKAMWKALDGFDAITVNQAALERHRTAFEADMADLALRITGASAKSAA